MKYNFLMYIIMDQYAFDEHSIVHLAVGILSYQSGFSFITLAILYSIFKIVGNTSIGMYVIDNYVTPITGYKLFSESFTNIFTDLTLCFAGWFIGYLLLDKDFSNTTGVLVGIVIHSFLHNFINNHTISGTVVFILLGLIFKQVWFMGLGILISLLIQNFIFTN
jgi:hypothetical protein